VWWVETGSTSVRLVGASLVLAGASLVLACADAVRETALSHEVHIWMFLTAFAINSLFGGKIISP